MNLTINEAREAIYQHFAALWLDPDTSEPFTPYWFDDEKAEPENGPWVRLTVRHNAASPAHLLGGPEAQGVAVQQVGTIYLQYFQPPGTGSDVADQHLERFIKGFGFQKLADSSIRTQEARVRELGIVEQGRWWAANGTADFRYEQRQ